MASVLLSVGGLFALKKGAEFAIPAAAGMAKEASKYVNQLMTSADNTSMSQSLAAANTYKQEHPTAVQFARKSGVNTMINALCEKKQLDFTGVTPISFGG